MISVHGMCPVSCEYTSVMTVVVVEAPLSTWTPAPLSSSAPISILTLADSHNAVELNDKLNVEKGWMEGDLRDRRTAFTGALPVQSLVSFVVH